MKDWQIAIDRKEKDDVWNIDRDGFFLSPVATSKEDEEFRKRGGYAFLPNEGEMPPIRFQGKGYPQWDWPLSCELSTRPCLTRENFVKRYQPIDWQEQEKNLLSIYAMEVQLLAQGVTPPWFAPEYNYEKVSQYLHNDQGELSDTAGIPWQDWVSRWLKKQYYLDYMAHDKYWKTKTEREYIWINVQKYLLPKLAVSKTYNSEMITGALDRAHWALGFTPRMGHNVTWEYVPPHDWIDDALAFVGRNMAYFRMALIVVSWIPGVNQIEDYISDTFKELVDLPDLAGDLNNLVGSIRSKVDQVLNQFSEIKIFDVEKIFNDIKNNIGLIVPDLEYQRIVSDLRSKIEDNFSGFRDKYTEKFNVLADGYHNLNKNARYLAENWEATQSETIAKLLDDGFDILSIPALAYEREIKRRLYALTGITEQELLNIQDNMERDIKELGDKMDYDVTGAIEEAAGSQGTDAYNEAKEAAGEGDTQNSGNGNTGNPFSGLDWNPFDDIDWEDTANQDTGEVSAVGYQGGELFTAPQPDVQMENQYSTPAGWMPTLTASGSNETNTVGIPGTGATSAGSENGSQSGHEYDPGQGMPSNGTETGPGATGDNNLYIPGGETTGSGTQASTGFEGVISDTDTAIKKYLPIAGAVVAGLFLLKLFK